MASYVYTIGPLTWDTSDGFGFWRAPDGAEGMLDLRGLPACGEAGTSVYRQRALCWFPSGATPPANHVLLNSVPGDIREIAASTSNRWAIFQATGIYPNDINSKLSGLILDLMTNNSDPTAEDVVPTLESETIYLAGHSPVVSLPENWREMIGFREYGIRNIQRQQNKVAHWIEAEQNGKLPRGVAQKALGGLLTKRGVPHVAGRWPDVEWSRVVPARLRGVMRSMGGPRIPSTDLSDDFSTSLANWDGDITNIFAVSGGVLLIGGMGASARYKTIWQTTALSSDDMSAEIEFVAVNSSSANAAVRHSGTAGASRTMYAFGLHSSSSLYLSKVVSGTRTSIGGAYSTANNGDIIVCNASGSDISGFQNGVQNGPVTDTAISGNLYAGIINSYRYSPTTSGEVDNFAASDGLSGETTLTPNSITPTVTVSNPTVTPGAVSLTVATIAITPTVSAPTVTPGAVTLTPDAISLDVAVSSPTVSIGSTTLTPDAIASTVAVSDPTLTPGAVTLTVPTIAITPTVSAPTVTPGAVTLTPDAIAPDVTVSAPTISLAGMVTLTPDVIAPTVTVTGPSVVEANVRIGRPTTTVERLRKEPGQTLIFAFDFASALGDGEQLTGTPTVWVAPSGVTAGESAINSTTDKVTVELSGGTSGSRYRVTALAQTTAGNTLQADGILYVKG